MLKIEKIFIAMSVLAVASLASLAAASFYANVDISVSGVSFGDGTSTSFTIKSGSSASTGWSLVGGALSVDGPQGFSVTASDSSVRTFLVSSSSLESCVVNSDPGVTRTTISTSSATWSIAPSSMASCVPVPGNLSATGVSTSSATLNGHMVSIGAQSLNQRGFVWSTSTNTPTIDDCLGSTSASGSFGNEVFNIAISSLSASTTYYYRTFGVNRFGVAYASYGAFTTSAEGTSVSSPTLGATSISSITTSGASLSSSISSTGGENASRRGFVWGTSSTPTVDTCLGSSSEAGSWVAGSFSLSASGLSASTNYYVRSFAVNSAGTSYGTQNTFTTSAPTCPTLTGAASYNAYPTCGAASCSSGYTLSGSGASATCSSSGSGSSGGSGGAPSSGQAVSGSFGILINDGSATTTSQNVTVAIQKGSYNVTHVQLSETNDFSSATKYAYSLTMPFTLSSGYGAKTVYAKFWIDTINYSSNTITDSIKYAAVLRNFGTQPSATTTSPSATSTGTVQTLQPVAAVQPRLTSAQIEAEWRRAETMKALIEAKISQQETKNETASEKNARLLLTNSVKGKILLQVEAKGEAWYVNPDDSRAYYLGRPLDMFNVMRYFGLGATHAFITGNTYFPQRLWGKILLDVEDHGKAYYISPADKKKYYLGRPEDAFNVVRGLGLGISNANLGKIYVNRTPVSR